MNDTPKRQVVVKPPLPPKDPWVPTKRQRYAFAGLYGLGAIGCVIAMYFTQPGGLWWWGWLVSAPCFVGYGMWEIIKAHRPLAPGSTRG